MSTVVASGEERAALLEMARGIARRELLGRSAELDRGESAALAECWRAVVDVGLDRALLGDGDGGAELSAGDLIAVLEELAVGDGGVAMCVLLSNAALATLDEAQLAQIPYGARWVLVPSANELGHRDGMLDGRVPFVLGADGADGLVLLLDGPEAVPWALGADTPGVRVERDPAQLGLRAAGAALVQLTDAAATAIEGDPGAGAVVSVASSSALLRSAGTTVVIGAEAVSVEPGLRVAMSAAEARALVRAGTAAIARGIARRAYELALEYAQARRQGGVAIVEHEAVAEMLSAMAVRLACRTSTELGAERARIDPAAALAAKIAASDAAVATTTDAVQVFGGTGYMVETGAEKLMRDAKYCQLYPEPNWIAHAELMSIELCSSLAASTRSAAA